MTNNVAVPVNKVDDLAPENSGSAFNALSGAGGAGDSHAHSSSMVEMFLGADIVVQSVMIMLVVASIWSWAIIFAKMSAFKVVKFKISRFEKRFWSADNLSQLHDDIRAKSGDPAADIFNAGMAEYHKSKDSNIYADSNFKIGVKSRIYKAMSITRNRSLERLERSLGFLATVGSTAPFIGLFGTVWGIMNSFSSIAASKNTSIAIVAPGISEALFATAIGLLAAIPAVIAYNKFTGEFDKISGKLEDFTDELDSIISRKVDEDRS